MQLALARKGRRLDYIGSTSMSRIAINSGNKSAIAHLKLETENPGGSIKDRTALGLILDAINRGTLTAGKKVIESTSGNLGAAAAYICSELGFPFIAVIDPKTTSENVEKIKAYGATVVCIDQQDETGGYLLNRLRYIKSRLQTEPDLVWLNQYESMANVEAHYISTAPEIWMQMRGKIDVIFVAVSTGGTLAGISRHIRKLSPLTKIIAVDALGSIALGGQPGPRYLTGIGASRHSSFIESSDYSEVIHVTDPQAFGACLAVRDRTGLSLGGSSGAVVWAAVEWLKREKADRIVCLCPDGGENYGQTIFKSEWLTRCVPSAHDVAVDLASKISLAVELTRDSLSKVVPLHAAS